MAWNEGSLPPVAHQQWQRERVRSHDPEQYVLRGYEHDEQTWRHHMRSPARDSARSLSLDTTVSAPDEASPDAEHEKTAEQTPIQLLNGNGLQSLRNNVPRLATKTSLTDSVTRLQPVPGLEETTGSSSREQRLDQYDHCRRGNAELLSSLGCDGNLVRQWQQRQQGQFQVLPPVFNMMRPEPLPASPISLSSNTNRNDRPLNFNPRYRSPAELSYSYLSNSYSSPCSPKNGSISALPAACLPYIQPNSHLSHQKRAFALPPLVPMQQDTPPRSETKDSASLYAANYPIKQSFGSTTGVVATNPVNSSSGAVSVHSPTNALPPLLKHLEESCDANTGLEPSPSWSQLSPRFSQLPPISHFHRSSPSSPDELHRSRSIASSASSIKNEDGHTELASSRHLSSASSSSNDGMRYNWTVFGGKVSSSESDCTMIRPADHLAALPQNLPHSRVTPASPGPYIFLPPLPGHHESSIPRQLPTMPLALHSPQNDETVQLREIQHSLPPIYRFTQGPYRCQVHGCAAPPFQTQYLLNSHANVHSSDRPHYCPEPGCSRSRDGKGFKRKNEMIRHGLVHRSPGYACPFCVEREHKYPRPDNLLRHVHVRHQERGRDDQLLREVLSQRADGPSRGRRRRI